MGVGSDVKREVGVSFPFTLVNIEIPGDRVPSFCDPYLCKAFIFPVEAKSRRMVRGLLWLNEYFNHLLLFRLLRFLLSAALGSSSGDVSLSSLGLGLAVWLGSLSGLVTPSFVVSSPLSVPESS